MSIASVDKILTSFNPEMADTVSAMPSSQEIDSFTNKLISGATGTPEAIAGGKLDEIQRSLVSGLDNNPAVNGFNSNGFLGAQASLAGSVIGVDIVTKVAGSFSQSVNKLVSMQ